MVSRHRLGCLAVLESGFALAHGYSRSVSGLMNLLHGPSFVLMGLAAASLELRHASTAAGMHTCAVTEGSTCAHT